MTLDSLRKKMGLDSHDVFLAKRANALLEQAKAGDLDGYSAYDRSDAFMHRQSGRTMERIYLPAVRMALTGTPVLIHGGSPTGTRTLRDNAREWCLRAGANPKLILLRAGPLDELEHLYDHTCYHWGLA